MGSMLPKDGGIVVDILERPTSAANVWWRSLASLGTFGSYIFQLLTHHKFLICVNFLFAGRLKISILPIMVRSP
jgi:hypothetical protein